MTHIVGVVGLGTMGAGIVQVCLAAGHTVIGMDGVDAARDNLGARVEKGLQRGVAKGNEALRARLNSVIKELNASGVIDKAWVKWFGAPMLHDPKAGPLWKDLG